jgi:hypothetical protein
MPKQAKFLVKSADAGVEQGHLFRVPALYTSFTPTPTTYQKDGPHAADSLRNRLLKAKKYLPAGLSQAA